MTDSGHALAISYDLSGALTTLGPYLNSADTAALITSSLTTYATTGHLTALGLDTLYSVSQNYIAQGATVTASYNASKYVEMKATNSQAQIKWAQGDLLFLDLSSGSPTYAFKCKASTGNCRARGSMTATSFPTASDEKLKNSVEDLTAEQCGHLVDTICPKTYTRIDTGALESGFIAQDVEAAAQDMPHLAHIQYPAHTPYFHPYRADLIESTLP